MSPLFSYAGPALYPFHRIRIPLLHRQQPRTAYRALPSQPRTAYRAPFIFGRMLSVTFLGTSAARPTVERNVSAMALVREGETLLFECGEGTQRQMMRYGVSFALSEIFFTHLHADHFLGVIGLIRTLGLQARAEPIVLYGPHGAKKVLTQAIQLGVERVPFQVEIREVKPGDTVEGRGKGKGEEYDILVFKTEHGGGSVGYALRGEEERDRAKETGHSTAREAAQIALAARAKRLVLSHVSARYSISAEELVTEARAVFAQTTVAKDGMTVEVPYAD